MATRFYTAEQLGPNRALTPEGFLACTDVPVARTGTMIYGANEVPVAASADGTIKVHRDDDAVFHPDFLASLVGKSVVNDHPPADVLPENWKQYEVGVGLNPHRGTGMQADLLLMDLLIKDPDAIGDVISGKREISLGYDAEYEEIARGEGRQVDLFGNHIALVDAGRCGSRCAIGDHLPTIKGAVKMATKKTSKSTLDKLLSRISKAFHDKDPEEMKDAMEEMETVKDSMEESDPSEGGVHVHVGGQSKFNDDDHEEYRASNEKEHEEFRKRLDALEGKAKDAEAESETKEKEVKDAEAETKEKESEAKAKDAEIEGDLEEEAPEGTGDKARKARDSAYMEDSFQETVALAEILAPGIRIPTFDHAASPKVTLDAVCQLRRKALDFAYATPEGQSIIEEIHGKELNLSGMKCNAVRSLFKATAAMKKSSNNKSGHRTGDFSQASVKTGPLTLAQLNERNAKLYSNK